MAIRSAVSSPNARFAIRLRGEGAEWRKISARDLLGEETRARTLDDFQRLEDLLTEFLRQSSLLRPTLNHGDLHARNAALRSNGKCVIYDWSEAAAGPAGLSLRAVFQSCSRITRVLSGREMTDSEVHDNIDFRGLGQMARPVPDLVAEIGIDEYCREMLRLYIHHLAVNGYASERDLIRALPASALTGALSFLESFSLFSGYDELAKSRVRRIFEKRRQDIVELCDLPVVRGLDADPG